MNYTLDLYSERILSSYSDCPHLCHEEGQSKTSATLPALSKLRSLKKNQTNMLSRAILLHLKEDFSKHFSSFQYINSQKKWSMKP